MGLLEPSTGVLVHAFSSPPAPQLPTGVSLPLTHLFISLSPLLPAGVSLCLMKMQKGVAENFYLVHTALLPFAIAALQALGRR